MVRLTVWQAAQPMLAKTWRPRVTVAVDDVEAVDVAEPVVEPAADGKTLATFAAADATVIVDDGACATAVDDAGIAGPIRRMNAANMMMSDWKSADGLPVVGIGRGQRRGTVRIGSEIAVRVKLDLLREQLAGDALLDVVRLAGKQQQRLVLGFPAEPGGRAVVGVAIETSGYAQRPLLVCIGRQIGCEAGVRDPFHKSETEDRRGYAEDDVVARKLSSEVRLTDVATHRIRMPGDHEQLMHRAIRRPIPVADKACLANRTVLRDERRHDVSLPFRRRERHLRVDRRACPANHRVDVATGASVEIEPWAEAIGNPFDLRKELSRGFEKCQLLRAETRKRAAGSGIAAAHARIDRAATVSGVVGCCCRIRDRRSLRRGELRHCNGPQQYGR